MAIHVFTHSEPGGKEVNEDCLIARRHPGSATGYVCLLADGQGGRSNGAAAARMACETAWSLASQRDFDDLLEGETWGSLLEEVDRTTVASGGFTTLIALAANLNCAAGASCGDSKVHFARPSPSVEITEWTQIQRKNPPVGSGEAFFVPFACDDLRGGRLLITSDGVWKYCGYEALQAAFRQSEAATVADTLRIGVTSRSGPHLPDDFSVIAIDIG